MDVRLSSGPDPERVAAAFRRGGKTAQTAIRRGFGRALRKLQPALVETAYEHLPDTYATVLAASLSVRTSVRQSGSQVTVDARISAAGRTDRRKIADLEKGVLRHPVFGRRRLRLWTPTRPRRRIPGGQPISNPWVAQPVKPGFGRAAVDKIRPGIRREMQDVLDKVERTITGA